MFQAQESTKYSNLKQVLKRGAIPILRFENLFELRLHYDVRMKGALRLQRIIQLYLDAFFSGNNEF